MEKGEHSDLIQTSVKAGWTKFNERKKVTKLTLFRKYVDEVRFGWVKWEVLCHIPLPTFFSLRKC